MCLGVVVGGADAGEEEGGDGMGREVGEVDEVETGVELRSKGGEGEVEIYGPGVVDDVGDGEGVVLGRG